MSLESKDPAVFKLIQAELNRQRDVLEMVTAENYVSHEVMEAQGSCLTNKTAQGYPGRRGYVGCEIIDDLENLAIERCKKLFGAEHANVQPHSDNQAIQGVYMACCDHGDTVLSLNPKNGGHVTHGAVESFSGMHYNMVHYEIDPVTERLDYDSIKELALKHQPKMILAGYSAYTRELDFKKFREIADLVGAKLFVDMAHYVGEVAAGLHPNPAPYADYVTAVTHKSFRGPRGGFILCKKQYADHIDNIIFPCLQGAALEHIVAAKAVAFGEALEPEFKAYMTKTLENAKTLASELESHSLKLLSGGTDNHVVIFKLPKDSVITGKQAEGLLYDVGITVNKCILPHDSNKKDGSGVKLSTQALASRGMGPNEMKQIASVIEKAVTNPTDWALHKKLRQEVSELCSKFPVY